MAIEFNKFNNSYNNYNVQINNEAAKKAQKSEEAKVVEEKDVLFKGLENETDLLTQNNQNILGIKLTQFSQEAKTMAETTNEILASLGFGNYKVNAAQVASVSNGMKTVVIPGMQLAEDGAVEAHIKDKNGPFADLFA